MISIRDDKSIDWGSIIAKHNHLFKDDVLYKLRQIRHLRKAERDLNNLLIEYTESDLLLTGCPKNLRKLRSEYLKVKQDIKFQKKVKTKGKSAISYSSYYKKLLKIFDYNKFRDNDLQSKKWGAYSYLEALGVKSCLYCNRNYTVVYDRKFHDKSSELRGKVRPVLDHLFLRSAYPFFGISIYNLIPSCYECNSCLKGTIVEEKWEDHLNPLTESFHEVFAFDDGLTDHPIEWDSVDFNVRLIKSKNCFDQELISRAKINVDLFALVQLYNHHKEVILPMLLNVRRYGYGRIKDLSEKVEGLELSTSSWQRLIFGQVLTNKTLIKCSPFSKIMLDLALKYEVIKE